MNVMLVEDEKRVADFIQRGLRAEGWTVSLAFDGDSAINLMEQDDFDVVVMDVMLPGISGLEVCRLMRARENYTPVLVLSALNRTDDRIAGLNTGADDYLTKPFDFDELVARIQALHRRAHTLGNTAKPQTLLRQGEIQFDTRSLKVCCAGSEVELTSKERRILQLFLNNPDKIYTRERILNAVWGANEDPLTNVVDVYVGRLRKKLGPCGHKIETVRGVGYRLNTDSPES